MITYNVFPLCVFFSKAKKMIQEIILNEDHTKNVIFCFNDLKN